MNPVKNLDYLVKSVLSQMKKYGLGLKDYNWVMEMAVSGYQSRLRGFNMPSLVTARINIDAVTRVWPYPPGYIRYTKIAYGFGNNVWTLSVNPNMSLADGPPICDTPIEQAVQSQAGTNFGYYWAYWGPIGTPMYSVGGGFNINYYRDYPEKGYIQFAGALPVGYALVEYLSQGEDIGPLTLVPLAYESAMREYLKWQICLMTPELKRDAPYYEEQYKMQVWDGNIMAKGPLGREMLDILYTASGFNVR